MPKRRAGGFTLSPYVTEDEVFEIVLSITPTILTLWEYWKAGQTEMSVEVAKRSVDNSRTFNLFLSHFRDNPEIVSYILKREPEKKENPK